MVVAAAVAVVVVVVVVVVEVGGGGWVTNLFGNSGSVAALGAAMDLGPLAETVNSIHAFYAATISEWVKSADGLSSMLQKWTLHSWVPVKDNILAPEHVALVQEMLANENYSRCGKGAGLLNEWRLLLKSLNGAGAGHVVPIDKLHSWRTSVNSACDYVEMTHALHAVTVVLPQENNLNRRKAAAKKCITEIESKFNPGDSVLAYLRQVAHTGALALESAEPQEPEEKRARTD